MGVRANCVKGESSGSLTIGVFLIDADVLADVRMFPVTVPVNHVELKHVADVRVAGETVVVIARAGEQQFRAEFVADEPFHAGKIVGLNVHQEFRLGVEAE